MKHYKSVCADRYIVEGEVVAWLDDYLAGLRAKYPGYMVLVKQGNWYRVYDQDADVMHSILDWAVISVNGHCIASGSKLLRHMIHLIQCVIHRQYQICPRMLFELVVK